MNLTNVVLEQLEKDIEGAKENITDAGAGIQKLRKELQKLNDQLSSSEVNSISTTSKPSS